MAPIWQKFTETPGLVSGPIWTSLPIWFGIQSGSHFLHKEKAIWNVDQSGNSIYQTKAQSGNLATATATASL